VALDQGGDRERRDDASAAAALGRRCRARPARPETGGSVDEITSQNQYASE
jgi:hypothetical protein